MRVVLDPNVLVSALVFPGGPPESVFRRAIEGRFELVSSPALVAELGRVLGSKFGWSTDTVDIALHRVVGISVIVRPQDRVEVIAADPDDDRVLEAADEGRAEVIVSGDRHLLELGAWRGIPILRPAAFLDRVEHES